MGPKRPTSYSVALQAEGDRVMTREEIVELADAVASSDGIASGIGSTQYGAQLLVHAEDPDEAVRLATELFAEAAAQAGLPTWPVTTLSVVSEDDDLELPG